MTLPLHAPGSGMRRRQHGVSIVETMIGILIGMVVVLAIYNVLSLSESYKRTTTGIADTQVTGLFSQFVMMRELMNAGNGIASGTKDLATCNTVALKPLPAVITDGGGANVSDSIVIYYSTAPHVLSPVTFMLPMASVSDVFQVQSPTGFAANDQVVAIDEGGNCELTKVTAVSVPDAQGVVQISHPNTTMAYPSAAMLMNLGPFGTVNRTQYSIVNNQLAGTDLMTAGAVANPIAQNVVLMKVQYGIDNNANGVIDLWTPADASSGTDYSAAAVQGLTGAALQTRVRSILALRIAIVVRSDDYTDPAKDPAVHLQTATLFNCSANDATCQGRIQLNNTVMAEGFRHRIYETTIPLRNAIWNYK